mgnify:CR=1 FL=1
MRTVGLVPNRDRPVAHDLARRSVQWLHDHGVTVRIPAAEAQAVGLAECAVDIDRFCDDLELVISLGGDGTMLHTAALVYPAPVPIVGINAGNLGYLNAYEAGELELALDRLVRGEFGVSARSMVECTVTSSGPAAGTWHGLNEVVLEKLGAGRMVRLEVAIDDRPFTTYSADGVIVATPTGSTAYSFSARGPIVSPTARMLALTPVAPHMLFDRSLVLGADETIAFTVIDGRSVALNVDGTMRGELAAGDRVECRVATDPVNIVAAADTAFHQILKAKFSLPDR